jgi:hypothetical protein
MLDCENDRFSPDTLLDDRRDDFHYISNRDLCNSDNEDEDIDIQNPEVVIDKVPNREYTKC